MTATLSLIPYFTAGAFGIAGVVLALLAVHRFGGRL